MGVSKVIYGQNTLIDLTADTITADKLASGYTAHDMSGNPITGTMPPTNDIILFKSISYSNAVSGSTKIWSLSELNGLPISSLSNFDHLTFTLLKDDLEHTTNQVIYAHSFYPYVSYKNVTNYYYTGIHWYHSTNASSVGYWRSATSLYESNEACFQIKPDGVYFEAISTKVLKGSYRFTVAAKIKN